MVQTAVVETHLAIQESDNYQPASISPTPAAVAPAAGGSNSIKVLFSPESEAEPATPGTTHGKVLVPSPNDPNALFQGTPAYFILDSGRTIIYSVESGKPLPSSSIPENPPTS